MLIIEEYFYLFNLMFLIITSLSIVHCGCQSVKFIFLHKLINIKVSNNYILYLLLNYTKYNYNNLFQLLLGLFQTLILFIYLHL